MYGLFLCAYCVFSRDVMIPIFVSQNAERAAMSVSQNNPVGVKLFCYVIAFFCSNKFCIDAGHVSENTEYMRVFEKIVIYFGIKTPQRKERTQVYVAKKKKTHVYRVAGMIASIRGKKTARISCHNFEKLANHRDY